MPLDENGPEIRVALNCPVEQARQLRNPSRRRRRDAYRPLVDGGLSPVVIRVALSSQLEGLRAGIPAGERRKERRCPKTGPAI